MEMRVPSWKIWLDPRRRVTGRRVAVYVITLVQARVKVKIHLKQNYRYWTIWDVIGKNQGNEVSGRVGSAWEPSRLRGCTGRWILTAELPRCWRRTRLCRSVRHGWKPDRTIVFASWDAEEEGLIGSTEWGEEHEKDLPTPSRISIWMSRSLARILAHRRFRV